MRKIHLFSLLASCLLALTAGAQPRVSLSVDASRPVGEMNPLGPGSATTSPITPI